MRLNFKCASRELKSAHTSHKFDVQGSVSKTLNRFMTSEKNSQTGNQFEKPKNDGSSNVRNHKALDPISAQSIRIPGLISQNHLDKGSLM
jgi:hypothetical protein